MHFCDNSEYDMRPHFLLKILSGQEKKYALSGHFAFLTFFLKNYFIEKLFFELIGFKNMGNRCLYYIFEVKY